jgi:hypothetical protein
MTTSSKNPIRSVIGNLAEPEKTWAEVDRKAKRRVAGYRTIRKLLTDPEYDK